MASTHTWQFFRAGGFDQAQIDTGADLLALKELDQKLWVALSCPTRGIEFDSATLDLIDQDADGRVHANEVLAAIAWAAGLLKNADLLTRGSDGLALADIDDGSEEGRQVIESARYILGCLGKADATEISLADITGIEAFIAGLEFNGDGVIHPTAIEDPELRRTIEDIIASHGSVPDLSGEAGIDQALSDGFFAEAAAWLEWQASGDADAGIRLLGEHTQAAADAFHAVRDKVDDYFTRCHLAAYDPRAAAPLSRSEEDYQRIAAQPLSAQHADIANFPLAMVAPGKPLPLAEGVNPAWRSQVAALREQVVVPLLGSQDSLAAGEWAALEARFAGFDAWQASKPACRAEVLGRERLHEISAGGHQAAIDALLERDREVAAEISGIRSVEKLLRYARDLHRLTNNFVAFRHFYTGTEKAIFQLGTLYLDGRACDLCVKVEDVDKHAEFANGSGLYLAYCECVRDGGAEKMNIAAAFTAGDSDFLVAGRNGLFYDRKGRDWDATIVRIVDHPISVRQAFWSPYKKLARFIGEQLRKFASSRAAAADEKLVTAAVQAGTPVAAGTPPPPPRPPFDVGKFAGIFAAIGLALGAIGGVLASLVSGILGLKFWQIPLAILGLLLLVSGPAILVAWFKLKQRNLGPVLDANGWAINTRARINIPFGTSLTQLARLPQGARRSLADPYADRTPVWLYLVIAIGIGIVAGMWYMGALGGVSPTDVPPAPPSP